MLIGLVGKKGAGKDTVADFLIEKKGYNKKAFADPLKKVVQALFLLDETQVHDQSLKEITDPRWSLSPRQMMQLVGTNLIRTNLGEDFWLKHIELGRENLDFIVISDVRFQNEADWVRKKGGILIRIVSNEESNSVVDTHRSETELESIHTDHVLFNEKKMGIEAFHNYLEHWFAGVF